MCIQGCNVNSKVCSFELYLGNFLKNAIFKTFKRFFFHIKFCFWWFLKQLFCMLHTGYRGRKAILLLRFFLHSDHIRKSYVNVYKHVYILPLYRFMHFFFFFWIFRNKTDRSCQTKSRRFFQLKSSELQTYHYNCDGVKIFESWKIILPVFYPSIKSKKNQ